MQRTCSKSPRDTKGSLAIQASLSFATRSWKYRWSVHKAAVILMMRAAVSHTVLGGRRAGTVLAGPGEELSRFLEAHVLLGTFSGPRFALQLW
eukprot:s5227_g1.t1